ncbi:hypothetical protein IE53DRAFT_389296 [Violaceomyces palustris]|uniref:Uncharacterized protein n=1 Tax=Violaceomyces palustris TaxID=1673888 RepID=A0ACD0NRP7_9BASI|nr:hypothetical protein IE53DRAFT_389296 [Violaceomyces palustris]
MSNHATARARGAYPSNHLASLIYLLVILLFLSSVPPSSSTTTDAPKRRDGWRPATEEDGAVFVLGNGKAGGVTPKNWHGPSPIWLMEQGNPNSNEGPSASPNHAEGQGKTPSSSSVRGSSPTASTVASTPKSPAASSYSSEDKYLCTPVSDCEPCPKNSLQYPYCRPYNNRRAVSCTLLPKDGQGTAKEYRGWEACGKVVKQEARDYLEFLVSISLIAILSICTFVHRQKVLSHRQMDRLESRISGRAYRA